MAQGLGFFQRVEDVFWRGLGQEVGGQPPCHLRQGVDVEEHVGLMLFGYVFDALDKLLGTKGGHRY